MIRLISNSVMKTNDTALPTKTVVHNHVVEGAKIVANNFRVAINMSIFYLLSETCNGSMKFESQINMYNINDCDVSCI